MSRRNRGVVRTPLRRGPDQGRPSFRDRDPLPLAEYPTTPEQQRRLVNAANSYLRLYRLGDCSVLVTREYGWWHLSVAHPTRYPTWDEIAEAKYRLLPRDITAALVLPPGGEYLNIDPNCFQVVEIDPIPDVPRWKGGGAT